MILGMRGVETTLAPSDVAKRPEGRERLLVGGRIVAAGETDCRIADALATLHVRFAEKVALTVGELAVVEGRMADHELDEARVIAQYAGAEPTAMTEFGRLAFHGVGRRLAARAHALRVVRAYFEAQGFIEVETPVRVPSPGLDAHVDAIRAGDGWLVTSPEFHMKRLVVGGLPRVFQIARSTRADEEGALHEPEFTLVEWYRAFSDSSDVLADAEALVSEVVCSLSGEPFITLTDGRRLDVRPPFERTTVRDAFRHHAGVADAVELARVDPGRYFELLVGRVEPGLARRSRPIVLEEFPITEAAMARPCAHDPSVAERFEVYAGGVELCNGFGELTDPREQLARFEIELERRKRASAPLHPIDQRFLAALREGLPPSGGNALGFDRLVALALSAPRIADVMAFPNVCK